MNNANAAEHVKERPILFSAPMVRALLAGSKTQTRRVAKLNAAGRVARGGRNWHVDDSNAVLACPYGQAGDRLWVRETFSVQRQVDGEPPPFNDGRPVKHGDVDDPAWLQPHYRATDPAPDLCCDDEDCRTCEREQYGAHWKPSIHMPRWASRITLKLTAVRVEQLQDISSTDALAEGIESYTAAEKGCIGAYRALWNSINGASSWDANPWVWVIEFRRLP